MVEETLHGPWLIRLDRANRVPLLSLVVSGSDGADGRYIVNALPDEEPALTGDFVSLHGTPFSVLVQGDRWSIRIEEENGGAWAPSQAQPPAPGGGALRRTSFDVEKGLVVTLETGSWAWHPDLGVPFSDLFFLGLRLECVSNDPSTNPIPFTPPYDFTLPHGPGE